MTILSFWQITWLPVNKKKKILITIFIIYLLLLLQQYQSLLLFFNNGDNFSSNPHLPIYFMNPPTTANFVILAVIHNSFSCFVFTTVTIVQSTLVFYVFQWIIDSKNTCLPKISQTYGTLIQNHKRILQFMNFSN